VFDTTGQIFAFPSEVFPGGTVTLNWSAVNASSCLIVGIGDVPCIGSKTVVPSTSTDYYLYASARNAHDQRPTNLLASVHVEVRQLAYAPPQGQIVARPEQVSPGDPVQLVWTASNASRCSIQGIGNNVGCSGMQTVYPSVSTTYTLKGCGAGECYDFPLATARVTVIPNTAARSFLRPNEQEGKGYGLYSYILFAHPPRNSDREAYRALVQIYLSQFRPKEEYESRPNASGTSVNSNAPRPISENPIESGHLNVIFLPVKAGIADCIAPKAEGDDGKAQQDCIIDKYDYRRASNLLRELDMLQPLAKHRHIQGPYIVSTLVPIDRIRTANFVYLNQDLTRVPANVVQDHVNEFIDETSRPSNITRQTFRRFMLGLRTSIAQAAGPIDDVVATISLVRGGK
jgi:hypothetical protein